MFYITTPTPTSQANSKKAKSGARENPETGKNERRKSHSPKIQGREGPDDGQQGNPYWDWRTGRRNHEIRTSGLWQISIDHFCPSEELHTTKDVLLLRTDYIIVVIQN